MMARGRALARRGGSCALRHRRYSVVGSEQLQELISRDARGLDDLMQRARRKVARVDRYDDAMPVIGVPEYLVASFVRSSSQPHGCSARTAWRGVTAGSRGVTRRR